MLSAFPVSLQRSSLLLHPPPLSTLPRPQWFSPPLSSQMSRNVLRFYQKGGWRGSWGGRWWTGGKGDGDEEEEGWQMCWLRAEMLDVTQRTRRHFAFLFSSGLSLIIFIYCFLPLCHSLDFCSFRPISHFHIWTTACSCQRLFLYAVKHHH